MAWGTWDTKRVPGQEVKTTVQQREGGPRCLMGGSWVFMESQSDSGPTCSRRGPFLTNPSWFISHPYPEQGANTRGISQPHFNSVTQRPVQTVLKQISCPSSTLSPAPEACRGLLLCEAAEWIPLKASRTLPAQMLSTTEVGWVRTMKAGD